MRRFKSSLRLYGRFFSMHLKSAMEYKVSFILILLGQMLVTFHIYLGIYFMMARFRQVEGFTHSQVLLCFSIHLFSFTLAETLFRGLDMFSIMIGNGEFDRILLRPCGAIFQIICSQIELTYIGRLLQASVMILYCIISSRIRWNILKIMTLAAMVVGGIGFFISIYIVYAALSFFTLEGLEFMNIFLVGTKEYGKYPAGIYGRTFLKVTTYLIPFALFQYYPFLYLIDQSTRKTDVLLPLLSLWILIPSLLFWRFGLRHYQSTGS